jgi:hypothetical protein
MADRNHRQLAVFAPPTSFCSPRCVEMEIEDIEVRVAELERAAEATAKRS